MGSENRWANEKRRNKTLGVKKAKVDAVGE